MKNKILLLLVASAMLVTGCKARGGKCPATPTGDTVLATPYTDSLKLAQADKLEGASFASTSEDSKSYEHYGYVTLKSCTDGDTANFSQKGYVDEDKKEITIKTRFLGVNTPESTAKVEPWGKRASLFTKHILEAAQAKADEESAAAGKTVYNIALITDPETMGERDSSGNRWLAFVWYRKSSSDAWRNLNLELVEQGYSRNQLFIDSKVCDYRKSFEAAGSYAEKCGIRVYGEEDDKFDYTAQAYEYSLWGIKKHYDEIGINDEGGSGVQLIVTALVVGIQGDNMYLRDVLIDEEQYEEEGEGAQLFGLYAYVGFNTALCSTLANLSEKAGMDGTGVGLVVRFFARATTYGGNIQLSDVKTGTSGAKAFRVISADNFEKYKDSLNWSHQYKIDKDFTFADLNVSTAPVAIDNSKLDRNHKSEDCNCTDLLQYQYQWIQVNMKIRKVTPSEDDDKEEQQNIVRGAEDPYWNNSTSESKAYTIYASIEDKNGESIYTNIRVDASLNPYVAPAFFGTSDKHDVSSANSPVGKTYKVTGYFVKYFDKFQVQLANNYLAYKYIELVG